MRTKVRSGESVEVSFDLRKLRNGEEVEFSILSDGSVDVKRIPVRDRERKKRKALPATTTEVKA